MEDIGKLLQETIDQRPVANGLAIIVANARSWNEAPPLHGVYRDLEAMKRTFEELRYATFPIYDATADQIKGLVRAAAHPSGVPLYPQSYKRLVFAFAGHGDVGVIQTHTGPVNLLHDVIEPFQPRKSPHIGDFPKLFFIDACRGTQTPDNGTEVPIPRGANGKSQLLPSEGNYLLAHSTLSNMKAYEKDGGLWMQTVAKMLREEQDSVGDVLQKVNRHVIKKFGNLGYPLQQPIYESTLNSDPFSLRKEADELSESQFMCALDSIIILTSVSVLFRSLQTKGVRTYTFTFHPKQFTMGLIWRSTLLSLPSINGAPLLTTASLLQKVLWVELVVLTNFSLAASRHY